MPKRQPNSMIAVIISANLEWRAVLEALDPAGVQRNPYSEHFFSEIAGEPVVFLHGGWGKISAAATAQFCIDTWHPQLIVNLGTCGGLEGAIRRGETLLVNETVSYDIYERMGNPEEALQFYTTSLDLSFLHPPYPQPVVVGRLASADQDIDPQMIALLREKFGVVAADWESASIAWVAAHHALPCLILRTVSDVVSPSGGEIYDDEAVGFEERAREIMHRLVQMLPEWLKVTSPPSPLL
jgi:Nucleoside phosphorylase